MRVDIFRPRLEYLLGEPEALRLPEGPREKDMAEDFKRVQRLGRQRCGSYADGSGQLVLDVLEQE